MPLMVSRRIEHDEKIHVEELTAKTKRSAVVGLRKAADHVLRTARHNAPYEVGDLERSGAPSVDASRLIAAVSFNTPYAVRQHEEMGYDHPVKGDSKYLERALIEEAEAVRDLLAKHIGEAFR